MSLLTPTTELEAVNECLENIGQAPVNTLAGNLGVDTQMALNFVTKNSRQLQSQGWYWNMELNFPMAPNVDGDIFLPENTLSVRMAGKNKGDRIVQRVRRLYDIDNRTYTFTEAVNVDLTLGVPFEELPETARRYIALKAARQFQNRIEMADDGGDQEDEMRAMADLKADQLRVMPSSALTDNWTVAGTVRRHAYGYTPFY